MNRRLISFFAVAAISLASCGGGGGSHGTSTLPITTTQAPNFPPYTGPAALASFTWNKQLVTQMQYVGPAGPGAMEVHVGVKMQDPQGLTSYAQQVSDPASPMYRHFLTPQQIGDRFGASQADYTAAANYLASFGMSVGGWPQREMLTVTGSYQQLGAAFGTTFGRYTMGNLTGIAPVSTPHLARIAPITSVDGLANVQILHNDLVRITNAFFTGYSPQQLANGLDYSGAWKAHYTGTGMTIGIIGTGPIDANDVPRYGTLYNAPMAPVTQVNASPQSGTGQFDPNPGGLASPPPVTDGGCSGPLSTCNPEDGEAQLDTESVAGLAPGANVLFYLAYNPTLCVNNTTGAVTKPPCVSGTSTNTPQIGIQLLDDEIQQAIADNKADAVSISVGGPENAQVGYAGPSGLGTAEFASLVAEGIAVFISSGDDGAWEAQNTLGTAYTGLPVVSYPASDPNVVGVGGVNIPLDPAGRLTNQITTWGDNTTGGGSGTFKNDVGSGGGISGVYSGASTPLYQTAALGPITAREVPDIALDADPLSGPAILMNSSFPSKNLGASGGTSAAAPEAAAMWALVLQACQATTSCATGSGPYPYRLGNPNPLLYSIYACASAPCKPLGTGSFTSSLPYSQAIYDVIYGSNQAVAATPGPASVSGYSAGPGYDMVTGIGVPFAGHLINAIVKPTQAVP